MRKLLTRLALAGAVLALVGVVASPVQAGCSDFDRTFGTYPSSNGTGCGPYYCYVISSGDATLSSLEGYYWAVGSAGSRNSGQYLFDGTGGSQAWGAQFVDWSIASTVNNGLTTGCPDGQPMVFLFSDTSGGSSLYGLAAVDQTLAGAQAYDIGLAGNLTLQPMPNCTITNTSRGGGGELIVDLSWTPNAASAFTSSSGTITNVGQVVLGWNFYSFEVPRGNPAPTNRNLRECGVSGTPCKNDATCDAENTGDTCQDVWTLRGTIAGSGSTSGQITFSCDDPTNNEVFLSIGPDLVDGQDSWYVGGNSTRIECDPNLADPGDRREFKLIETPKSLKRR